MFEDLSIYGKPEKGKVLVSEPFIFDSNFKRSVILLCEHNEEGSFGLILNRPLDVKLGDVVENLFPMPYRLHLGGPVQNDTLHILHRIEELSEDSEEILPGLYWGTDFEKVKEMIANNTLNPDDIRFYLGYSGWGAGQLMEEMSFNSWVAADVSVASIFDENPDDMWKNILKGMGGALSILANSPENPNLN